VLEGFTKTKIPPWARRLVSRCIAIVPSFFVIQLYGAGKLNALMVLSQVVLSAQLSFAVFPLIQFTSNKEKMGPFVNGPVTKAIGWTVAFVIAGLKRVHDRQNRAPCIRARYAWRAKSNHRTNDAERLRLKTQDSRLKTEDMPNTQKPIPQRLRSLVVFVNMNVLGGFSGREIPVVAIQALAVNHALGAAVFAFDIRHLGETTFQAELRL